MKKFLLSLTLVVLGALGVSAKTAIFFVPEDQPVETDASCQLTGTVAGNTYTAGDISLIFHKVNSSASKVNGSEVRFYANDSLTVRPSVQNAFLIKKVTLSGGSTSNPSTNYTLKFPSEGDGTTFSTSNTSATFTSENGAEEVRVFASKQCRITYVLVEYEATAPKEVEDVEISYELNGQEAQVTLSCATEGATIHYGFAEDAINQEYSDPFTVTEYCTVYAYATKGEAIGETKSLPIKIYKSFKDIVTKASDNEEVSIAGNFSVLYQNGNYVILTDGNSNILVYDTNNAATHPAETAISSLSGKVSYYNNLFQLIDVTMEEGGSGATYEPIEVSSLADINYDDNLFDLIVIKGCAISNKDTKTPASADITLNDETIKLYNRFGLTFANGDNLNITGFVWRYTTTVQVAPTVIDDADALEVVATPVILPAVKELQLNDEITITCATADAVIYYTLDGSDPTQESTRYVGAFHFEDSDVTVKARAYYEGEGDAMTPSEIAERTYHVFNPKCNVITTENHEGTAQYTKHTCTVDKVDYAMYGYHSNGHQIQMKNQVTDSKSPRFCYIVQVSDNEGLAIESIVVDFSSTPDEGETITILGSNTPYDVFVGEAYDLAKESESIKKNGDEIGKISATNTTVSFEKDYNYFAFYPTKNTSKAFYMNSITINYREPKEANEEDIPEFDENFEANIISDANGILTDDIPQHEDWIAKYSINGSEPKVVEGDYIHHEDDIDAATLHTIEIWYEHYYHGTKSARKTFYHVTDPVFGVVNNTTDKKTVINFSTIGEGVKVYFTLDGSNPEVPSATPASVKRRASAAEGTYALESADDLATTHVITSATKTVEIPHGLNATDKKDNYTLKTVAVHENGYTSDVTTNDAVPTSIVELSSVKDGKEVYDLQGRMVVAPVRGLYIVDGAKKFVR